MLEKVKNKILVAFWLINYSLETPNFHDPYTYSTTVIYDRKLIYCATLKAKDNHCNYNCSLVMTPQKTLFLHA